MKHKCGSYFCKNAAKHFYLDEEHVYILCNVCNKKAKNFYSNLTPITEKQHVLRKRTNILK